jgi:hypothetical protein
MVFSDCSSAANSTRAVVSNHQHTLQDENAKLLRLPSHNSSHRQYTRKDDNPIPTSPTKSVVMDADESCSSLDDMFYVEAQRTVSGEDDDEWDSDDPIFERRVYDSPRLVTDDNEIFPSPETHALYQDSEQRWQQISEAAGFHRQDGSRLVIRPNMNPTTLRCGIVSQFVGRRVHRLSLWLDDEEDILPHWLDTIVDLFPNLQELYLFQDSLPNEKDIAVSARMRRLYILYRIPHLLSIDGEAVQPAERELARPSTPSGARVQQNDWMHEDDEYILPDPGRNKHLESLSTLESLQIPANASIGSNTAMELGAELAQLAVRVAMLHGDNGEVSSTETILDDDDSLFGEDLIGLAGPCVSHFSCEERQDLGSGSREKADQKPCTNSVESPSSQSPSVVGVDAPPPPPPSNAKSQIHRRGRRPSSERGIAEHASSRNHQSVPGRGHSALDESYELVSVASSHHEWTAACGVLSFRTDQGCAPRLRLNFLGKNRKRDTDTKNTENNHRSPSNAVKADCESPRDSLAPMQRLRLQKDRALSGTLTNLRRSNGEVPSNAGVMLPSANQMVPPTKSLTSPFPMQFRERKSLLHVSTSANDLSATKTDGITLSAPRARGSVAMDTITKPMTLTLLGATQPVQRTKASLTKVGHASLGDACTVKSSKNGFPPPCPGAVRRKVGAASLLQREPLERKVARRHRRMDRRMKVLQRNARSSSMMDGLDDDSTDSDEDNITNMEETGVLDADISLLHQGNQW